MPYRDGGLKPRDAAFIEAYVGTNDLKLALARSDLPQSTAYALLARPEVQNRIVQMQTARIATEALPLAVDTLISILGNDKAPAAARVQAAKVVLDRTLPMGEGARAKDLHELTPGELAQQIAILEDKAAALAKPINAGETGIFD